MKKYFLLAALFLSCVVSAQSYINVGQFNIRYENRKDKEQGDGWDSRAQHLYDLVNYEGWDIFGVQEALYGQVNDLAANLDGYDYIGVGRQDGSTKGEFVPIFYRKSRIKCLDQGCFWLSETPEVIGSKGWDAKYPRICTWGQFKDLKSGKKFWMFNLHLDHRGVEARRQSCHLVLEKVKQMCGKHPFSSRNVQRVAKTIRSRIQDPFGIRMPRVRVSPHGPNKDYNFDTISTEVIFLIFCQKALIYKAFLCIYK